MKSTLLCSIMLTFTLLVGVSCQKKADVDQPAAAAAVVDSVLSEDGLTIYYQVEGAGDRVLVFVHCWSCDRSYWEAQVSEFSKDFKVVTIDLAGHGQSALGRENWNMASFGADVAAVVRKLDLNNAILIGHSMGGPVIIEAARRLPGRIIALIGVDNFQNFERTFPEEQIDQFLVSFRADFATTTDEFVRAMFPPTADSQLVEQVVGDMSSAPPEVGISAMGDILRYDYAAALQEVRLPIRTINSDKFPINTEANKRLAESFETRVLSGTGHFLHMENPSVFNLALHATLMEFWPE